MTRRYLGPALALGALVAGVIAAVGPAIHERAQYHWLVAAMLASSFFATTTRS
jgi:hypothetical protein